MDKEAFAVLEAGLRARVRDISRIDSRIEKRLTISMARLSSCSRK